MAIRLSAEDKVRLERNVRRRTTPFGSRTARRLSCWRLPQIPDYRIAEQLGLDANTVGWWHHRYAAEGHADIEKDRPRGANHGGKNTIDQARIRSLIIDTTMQQKLPGATHWPVRNLARYLGVTHSLVGRVWQEVGLKPHLEKRFKVSDDPHFEAKLHDVVGLYMDPPEHAVVLCVDEESSIQALDRTEPGLPLKPGCCGTITHKYKRHGTSTLFAALVSPPAK